jgi:hypothetical protein
MRRLLHIIVVIAFGVGPPLICGQDQRPSTQPSILNAPGETVRVQLFDAWSGQRIANADIKVESNNGVVCRTAPCPKNAKQWLGRSDDAGRVIIPRPVLQFDTYVSTELHEGADLKEAVPGASDTWVIELFPKRLKDAGEVDVRGDKLTGLDLRGYKLLAARTGKPLANKAVRIEFPLIGPLDTKTNSLGYVFFPLERALGPSFEPEAWVTAAGYQRTKLDLDAPRQGTKLKRQ